MLFTSLLDHVVKIYLSSIFTLEPDKWHIDGLDQILDYTIDKYFADNFLVNQSDLKYTILQPTNLTEEKGTGKISLDVTGVTSNPIPDVQRHWLKSSSMIILLVRLS